MSGEYEYGAVYIKVKSERAREELNILDDLTNVKWGGTKRPTDYIPDDIVGYLAFWKFKNGTPDFNHMMYSSNYSKNLRSTDEEYEIDDFIARYFGTNDMDNFDSQCNIEMLF